MKRIIYLKSIFLDTDEDEVDDIDNLLSNYGSRLWEE